MMESSVFKGLILIRKTFLALTLPSPSAPSASADFLSLSGSNKSVYRKFVPNIGVVFDFAGVSDLCFDPLGGIVAFVGLNRNDVTVEVLGGDRIGRRPTWTRRCRLVIAQMKRRDQRK